MRSEVIACKYPGQSMSPIWLDAALKTHNTCVGYAIAKDGIVLHTNFLSAETPLKEAIEATQTKYKKEHVFFYFAHVDKPEEEYGPDSYQPFPLLKGGPKGEDTLLAVMLEGDFTTFDKNDTEMAAFHFVKEYLEPKIVDMFGDIGNLDKLMAKIDGPVFRKEMMTHLQPRGYMLFLPNKGQAVSLSNNKQGGAYEWGLASKDLGIPSDMPAAATKTEAKAPVVDVVASGRPLSFAEKKAREKALAASGGVPPVSPTPDQKPGEIKPEGKPVEKKEVTPFHEVDGVLWVKPPSGTGHKEARIWWNRHTRLPRPANEKPELLFAGFPATNLAADSPLYKFLAEKDRPLEPENSAFTVAMKEAEAKKTAKAKTDADEVAGVLTLAEKQEIVRERKQGQFGAQSPEDIIALTKPEMLFSEQVQVPFDEILHAPAGFFFKRNKRELMNLCLEFRLKLIYELRSKKADKPVEVKVPGQEELPLKKEEPVVTKTMTFAEKKAAERQRKAA